MKAKAKVLYLMSGDPHIFGGGKRGFLQLMSYLDKNLFQVYSCCALNEDQEKALKSSDVNIVKIDIQHGMILPAVRKLLRFLRSEKIDIIHSQGARADVYCRIVSRLAGLNIKTVNTIQMLVEGYDVHIIKKKVYCYLDRLTERCVDKFIVVSDMLKNRLIHTHRIAEKNVEKIYNGIELNQYRRDAEDDLSNKLKCEFGLKSTDYLVGAIGRMVWQKGFKYLVHSIPKTALSIPQVKIIFIGEGPLTKPLEDLCKELGVRDKVIFTGFRKDIKDLLSIVDLLAIPSLLEGFPMITLEAMAMAKPIIATRIDGITEQIRNGENGLLVPIKDSEALSEAIIRIYNNREMAEKMGKSGRKQVEKTYSIENTVRQTQEVYDLLIND